MTGDEATPRRFSTRRGFEERGQGIVEYVLIIALVGLGSILALGFLSGEIQELFFKSGNALEEGTESIAQPPNGTTGSIPIPPACPLVGGQTINYTYYQANTVYGPGTELAPKGYEGIYVTQADAVLLLLGSVLCPGSANFPPTSFDIGGEYDFDCFWSFATWRIPGNAALTLGGRCAVAPVIPSGGSVTLAPGGPVPIGTTLTATTAWAGNPETYRFTWQRTGQSTTWAADCSNATGWDTFATITVNSETNANTQTASSAGNRCYRVTVRATSPAGNSAPPEPISNAVRVDLPPAPSGGTINLAPAGPNPLGTQLVATTGGWSPIANGDDYDWTWQRTGQSGTWTANCSNASGWDTYANANTTHPDVDTADTISNTSEGDRCYRVTVTAQNAGGTSAPITSNAVLIQLPPPPTPGSVSISPGGPVDDNTDLTATVSGWGGTVPGVTQYQYSWERTASNTPTCAGAYSVYNTGGPTTQTSNTDNADSVRCYRVRVRGTNNGGGTYSAYSGYSNVVMVLDPPQPGTVTIGGANPQNGPVTLTATTVPSTWSVQPTTTIQFEWQRTNTSGSGTGCGFSWNTFSGSLHTQNVSSPSTSDTLTGADNFCYRVRVRGSNAVGQGNYSNTSASVRVN